MEKFFYIIVSVFLLFNLYLCIHEKIKELKKAILFSFVSYTFINLFCSFLLACLLWGYSLYKLTWFLLGITFWLVLCNTKQKRYHCFAQLRFLKIDFKMLVIFGCAFYLFAFRTTEYFDGGRDPGIYYINAIRIAESGNWKFSHNSLDEEVYQKYSAFIWPGYPGLYSAYEWNISENKSDLVSQFLPGASCLFCIAYDLGGFAFLNRINGIVALLALGVFYYFVQDMSGNKRCAFNAILFLCLSPAYIWNARETTTEIVFFLGLITAIYVHSLSASNWKGSILSVLLLASLGIIRIDAYIIGIGFYVGEIILFIVDDIKERKTRIIEFAVYILATGIVLIYTYKESFPYFKEHLSYLREVFYINVFLAILFIIVVFIRRTSIIVFLSDILRRAINSKIWIIGICSGIYIIFKYAYCIRAVKDNAGFMERSAQEFCWYTSYLAVVFGIFGLGRLIYVNKRIRQWCFFIVIGMVYTIIYLYKPSISPDHMWASRRWISVAIPFVLALCAYGIEYVSKKLIALKIIEFGAVIVIVLYLIYQDISFMNKNLMENLHSQYIDFAQTLDDDLIYFTDNGYIAAPLKFVCKKPVYRCNKEDMETYVKETGETLYYIGIEGSEDLNYQCIKEYTIMYESLEKSIGKYPRKLINYEYVVNIYEISNRNY